MPASQKSMMTIFTHIIAPVLGVVSITKLLISLDQNTIELGLIWLGIGCVLLIFLLKKGNKLALDIQE